METLRVYPSAVVIPKWTGDRKQILHYNSTPYAIPAHTMVNLSLNGLHLTPSIGDRTLENITLRTGMSGAIASRQQLILPEAQILSRITSTRREWHHLLQFGLQLKSPTSHSARAHAVLGQAILSGGVCR